MVNDAGIFFKWASALYPVWNVLGAGVSGTLSLSGCLELRTCMSSSAAPS